MPGRTNLNTGVYLTLLQRGGKDWMLGYTRKMITISTDGRQYKAKDKYAIDIIVLLP